MARNPLNYTYRTYNEILSDLQQKFPGKADWFQKTIAGAFDVAHWYLDANVQNLILSSAVTDEALNDLLAYLDYQRGSKSPASAGVTVTVTSFPKTVLKEDLSIEVTNQSGSVLRYEALDDVTFSSSTSQTVYFYQGETVTNTILGTSNGTTEWQEFVINDADVYADTVEIVINSQVWTRQTNLVNSLASDRHFRVIRKPNGFYAVLFGNGTYGAIPDNYDIFVTYRRGAGSLGNFKFSTSTARYTGSDADVTGVTLIENFTGGSEEEGYETARFLAPQMLKRNDRAISEKDYELLSLRYSSGIKQAKCFPGLYGEGTVGVHIVPAGGGNPSGGLKIGLQSSLKEASTLGLTDVRVRDPIYVSRDITYQIKPRGVTFLTAKKYADFAAFLLVSETVKEILDSYEESGIAATTTLINTIFGSSFIADDYSTLIEILERRRRDGFNTWGSGLRINDIISAIDSLPQVDFMTISVPATDQTTLENQIMTAGTITGTVIV